MKKRHSALSFVSALLFLGAFQATAQQAAGDLTELLGVWLYQEYDGLIYEYEEITWQRDGTTICQSSSDGSYTRNGPLTVLRKWIVHDGSIFLKMVGNSGSGPCFILLRISPDGRCYEEVRVSSLRELPSEITPNRNGYRFYFR